MEAFGCRRCIAVILLFGLMAACQAPFSNAPSSAAVSRRSPPPPPPPSPPPPPPPGGDFSVTLVAESDCDKLPVEATRRSWSARIDPGSNGAEVVTLLGSRFLSGPICTIETGLGCDQFLLRRHTDTVEIDVRSESEWHGGSIVEQVSGGGWIEVNGIGTAPAGPILDAQLDGGIWYCPESRSYPFPCSSFTGCRSKNLRMTIAPKAAGGRVLRTATLLPVERPADRARW